MRQIPAIAIVLTLFTHGCAMERTVTKTSDTRPCVANYSTEGNLWVGKQFKTYEDFPKLEKNAAFDKLVGSIASSGWQMENSNKDLGIISASNTVSYGEGKTVPLNAVITNLNPRGNTSGACVYAFWWACHFG
jgi:hypothetical protein